MNTRFWLLVGCAVCCPGAILAQRADHVVISEFASQGAYSTSDEFVELYNPTEGDLPIAGWSLQYKPIGGTAWDDKAVLPSGAVIPAHGFYLLANTGYAGPTTADYTSSLWTPLAGLSSNGSLRIIDSALAVVDKVGYGTLSNDPEGSPAPDQGGANNNSIERKALATSTADSLAPGGAHYLLGNGYDTDNNANDFVRQTHGRLPQNTQSVPEPAFGIAGNGTGWFSVTPARVFTGRTTDVKLTVHADSGYALNVIKIVVPAGWSWTHDTAAVVLAGHAFDTAVRSIVGDTVIIRNAAVTTSDSGAVTFPSMTSPSAAGTSVFHCFTAVSGGSPAQILIQPAIRVKSIVPIVQIHINDAQGVPTSPYAIGAEVSVTGTVTANYSATQTNVFIQDATAGVCLYTAARPVDFHIGDSIAVTGTIVQFRGLIEVAPDFSSLVSIDTGKTPPPPQLLTCADVNATFQSDGTEPNEGRLVRLNGVSYNSAASTITDASGTTAIFIPTSFPPVPTVFDAIGILKQYKPGTAPPPPYTQNYELSPRFPEDIIAHPGPVFTSTPIEDSIAPTEVRVRWETDVPSSSMIYFGTSTYTDTVTDVSPTTSHSVWVSGLTPATFYHYAAGSADSNGTTVVSDFLMSSASPPGTTGQINAYFNRTVDTAVAAGEYALGNQDLTSHFLQRVAGARHSIDACFYNLSGNVGAAVASALVAAKNRGVRVRVIGEADNLGNAPYGTLSSNGVPVISDAFDTQNGGVGLMHNKFAIMDYAGGAPESVWVWTGSWNPTDPGTNGDRQNSIEVQDVALAGAYTAEFQQMWGSTTSTPSASASRFGARKLDVTPHHFNVAGTSVECYFSPSDRTTLQIGRLLSTAQRSISVAMYTFTRRDLADTLIGERIKGRKVRVVLDNNTDTGNQYSYLVSGGIDVHLKGFTGGYLHHKYALVDAVQVGGTQWTITGSHNWSSSAESTNDENTLFLRSSRVSNLYLQEFAARYFEAGGSDPIVLGVKETVGGIPAQFSLSQNYPNPFNPRTVIRFEVARAGEVSLKVFDVLGNEVAVLVDEAMPPGAYRVEWNAGGLASGIYFYQIRATGFAAVGKMMLIR